MSDEAPVKRWSGTRKSAVVVGIFEGNTTPVEVARQHYLTVAEVERWVEEAERNMENGVCTRPKVVGEQFGKELQETREPLGDAHLQIYALQSIGAYPMTGRTREIATGGAASRRLSCLT